MKKSEIIDMLKEQLKSAEHGFNADGMPTARLYHGHRRDILKELLEKIDDGSIEEKKIEELECSVCKRRIPRVHLLGCEHKRFVEGITKFRKKDRTLIRNDMIDKAKKKIKSKQIKANLFSTREKPVDDWMCGFANGQQDAIDELNKLKKGK